MWGVGLSVEAGTHLRGGREGGGREGGRGGRREGGREGGEGGGREGGERKGGSGGREGGREGWKGGRKGWMEGREDINQKGIHFSPTHFEKLAGLELEFATSWYKRLNISRIY